MLLALKDEKLSFTFSKVETGRVVTKLNKE